MDCLFQLQLYFAKPCLLENVPTRDKVCPEISEGISLKLTLDTNTLCFHTWHTIILYSKMESKLDSASVAPQTLISEPFIHSTDRFAHASEKIERLVDLIVS
jgi:hypothetical protein